MFYYIENEYISACISDYGATLVKLIDKKSNKDIILGFDKEEGYYHIDSYIGASVGRNANRIGEAKFILNDREYKLTANENSNQLHGGYSNFAKKIWKVKNKDDKSITLSYFSKNLEEGFPGNLNVEVSYVLDNNNLIWSYKGEADEDTILNMTNHSYFCLDDDNILNHELKIHTDKYSPVDEFSLTKDEVLDVTDSPYDFKEFRVIKDNLNKLKCGIDNNYVYESLDDKLMAELKNKNLQLNVYSDLPDMHLYTAYYLNSDNGKYNKKYDSYSGICLECQYYPNGINYNSYIKPILKKGETMSHYIRYEIISK